MFSFSHLLIIGIGLIGGSLSRSLRRAGYQGKITGIDRSEAVLSRAKELKLIDEASFSIDQVAPSADMIVVAVPVAQTKAILSAIKPHIRPSTIITDVGSTKSDVVQSAYEALGDKIAHFIPAHPIAGRETNGPDAAIDDLFEGKKLVITALPENKQEFIDRVVKMWKHCHAVIQFLTPEDHDNVFALVSHLPHLLSYALVDQVARHEKADLMFQYAASGFRDFTRIAGSSPEMWRDISIANQKQLLMELDCYIETVQHLRKMLEQKEAKAIEAVYKNAQRARFNWISAIESAEKKD